MRNTRPILWINAARKEFEKFPAAAQDQINLALTVAAEGGMAGIAKPFKGVGSGVFEIALKHRGDAFRVIYSVEFAIEIIAVDAFQKKSKSGIKTPQQDVGQDQAALEAPKGEAIMTEDDDMKLVPGSGNVFRDFGHPNADLMQAKAILAAKIIGAMDERGWTARAADKATGVAHTDLSRIRNVKLDRFTLDRLITILGKLDESVEVSIDVKPRGHAHPVPA